jgi:hypothetical protein
VSALAASVVVVIAEGLGHLMGADGHEHNCHVHHCWRIAEQQVERTTSMVCHRHHPQGKPTEAAMAALAEKRRATEAGWSITLTE